MLAVLGRASMTTSDAAGTLRRLRILTDEEIEALYGHPCFSADDRADYFALTQVEQDLLRSFHGVSSQLAFLLQLGYFKAKQLFFPVRFEDEDVAADVSYLLSRYFPPNPPTALPPNKRTLLRQHRLLLEHFGYRICTARERRDLARRAAPPMRPV